MLNRLNTVLIYMQLGQTVNCWSSLLCMIGTHLSLGVIVIALIHCITYFSILDRIL